MNKLTRSLLAAIITLLIAIMLAGTIYWLAHYAAGVYIIAGIIFILVWVAFYAGIN